MHSEELHWSLEWSERRRGIRHEKLSKRWNGVYIMGYSELPAAKMIPI